MEMDEDKKPSPWRIYGQEYKVSESKMGKARFEADMDKERAATEKGYPLPISSGEGSRVTAGGATLHIESPRSEKKKEEPKIKLDTVPGAKEKSMDKSRQMLEELGKSATPEPGDSPTDLLKACKACMDKSGEEKKAYLGELAIPEKQGAKPKFTGDGAMPAGATAGGGGVPKQGSEKIAEKQYASKSAEGADKATPIPIPVAKSGDDVDKAVTARSIPRMPPAMRQEMIRRNAQSVMTRGNSRFAKDIHTGPLTGEVIDMVECEAEQRTREVFKSCNMCGRRYKLTKGVDDSCPTCSIHKSSHCGKCGKQLLKSHGGSVHCPLCG